MHKRRIRYPVAFRRGLKSKHPRKIDPPYMLELLWPQWGRVYAYHDAKLGEDDHFVRYRFFARLRRRGGHAGWNMDKGRFWCSGRRRIERQRNFNLIEWLR